jgi:hypothetical protein
MCVPGLTENVLASDPSRGGFSVRAPTSSRLPGMEPITFELTVRQWNTIDAQMDNTAYMDRSNAPYDDDDDDRIAPDAFPTAIRQAGWDQAPNKADSPDDAVLQIALTRPKWEFVVAELQKSNASYEALGDQESIDLVRDAADAVTTQLAT